jgi:PAS domain S-box-containing protein
LKDSASASLFATPENARGGLMHELTGKSLSSETGPLAPQNTITGVSSPSTASVESSRLNSVLDGMSEGVLVLAPDFTVVSVNAEATRLDGRTREQIVGQSFWALYPGDEDEPLGALVKLAMHERLATTGELLHKWAEGRVSWLDFRAVPADDGSLLVFFRDVTRQFVAEQKAHDNEQRFRAAVQAFADALWTNDAQGRMVGDQPGWAALTGQSFDEYQDFGWSLAVHPDDAQPTIDAWNEAVAERRPFAFEHRVRRHDGQWRRHTIRAVPVLNEDGSVLEWVGVHSDITDLCESEARFRQLAETIDAVFYIHEIGDPHVSYVSPAYEKLWQRPVAELYEDESSFTRVVHPDDRALVDEALALQASGQSTETRYRLVMPDGRVRHIHDRSFVTNGHHGEPRRVVGLAEDVTDITEDRAQIASNATTFETLIRDNPFGVYVVDSDFKLLLSSAGTEKVFAGIDPLIGRDFAEVIGILWTEPFAAEVIGHFRRTLETGDSYIERGSMEQRANVGHVEAYHWRIDRIILPDGSFGVVCYFYDLTERVEIEAQLNQALADNELLIREIDHRVRNSITLVSSLLSMQGGTAASAEVKQALHIAAARLVAVARVHERLYKGKQLGVVEFGAYLEEICIDLRAALGREQATLMLQKTEINLSVDQAVPLGLIVNELVTNAFKHNDAASASIGVVLKRDEKHLTLVVSDTGNGMPNDYDAGARKGLGMQVINLLVEQLKGSMTLPAAGSEARFILEVPL